MSVAATVRPTAIASIHQSDIVSNFDIHKPQRLNELFMRYNGQGAGYFMLLKSLGFEKPVAGDTFGHNEENRIHETITSLSNESAPGPGNDHTITLDPSDLDASNRFYPRLGDVVLFKNETVGYIADIDVTTPSAPVLTIRPHSATEDLGAITAGEELAIFSGIHSEGSGQPASAFRGTSYYENDMQIIKESIGVTGSEMTNETWIPVTSEGDNIEGYYRTGQIDLDYRMALRMGGALLFGKRVDNPNAIDPVTGLPMKGTEGLVPYIRRVGHQYLSASGAFAMADFDTIDRILTREHAGKYVMTMLGVKRFQNIENLLKTEFADTNINYARNVVNEALFNKDEALAATVNFKLLTKSERTWCFKRMDDFSNPKTYGVSGYVAEDLGIMLPLNKKKDAKTGEVISSIGMRYKSLGKYNRKMEVWTVGGAGNGLKVTDIDKQNTYQRSHIGAHHIGGNSMVLISPSLP